MVSSRAVVISSFSFFHILRYYSYICLTFSSRMAHMCAANVLKRLKVNIINLNHIDLLSIFSVSAINWDVYCEVMSTS